MLTRTWRGIKLKRARRLTGAGAWLPAAGWIALISYLSQQSAPLGRVASSGEAAIAHLMLFGVLGLLLLWGVTRGAEVGRDFWVRPFFAFGLAVLFGLIDELHQAYVPGRTASEVDLVLDAAGAALGVGFGTAAILVAKSGSSRA